MMQLQRKVKVEKFFGGVNRKEKNPHPLVTKDMPKRIAAEVKGWMAECAAAIRKAIDDSFK